MQIVLALLTIAWAVVADVVFRVSWASDVRPVVAFIFIDAPLLLAALGGLLAIAISFAERSEWTVALVPVTALVVLAAGLLFFENPLLPIPALLLLLTTIACGVTMTRSLLSAR